MGTQAVWVSKKEKLYPIQQNSVLEQPQVVELAGRQV
jgi:hypothetical protein